MIECYIHYPCLTNHDLMQPNLPEKEALARITVQLNQNKGREDNVVAQAIDSTNIR